MTGPHVPPASVATFATTWARLWPLSQPVGLAVSGGPDSIALMLLAHAALGADAIMVATVDHGLRVNSADEAATVAGLCAARGIAHSTLSLGMGTGTAVQERARDERYRALDRWCDMHRLGALVTAHHADDQAETMVMRLNRGAGLRGVAAMRARAVVPGGMAPLLRPLLDWRRAALVDVVAQAGIVAVDDPSNHDHRFERVRVRAGLAGAAWIDPAGLARAGVHLGEADAALDWAAAQVMLGVTDSGDIALDPGLPRALALRVLERVLARFDAPVSRGRDLARWHDRLASGAVATLAGIRGDGRKSPWRFTRAAPHNRA